MSDSRGNGSSRLRDLFLLLLLGVFACKPSTLQGTANANHTANSQTLLSNTAEPRGQNDEPGSRRHGDTIDLLEHLQQGAIDVAGPVVDLGEPQATPFVLPPLPLRVDVVNGDSWASVGSRLRLRVPIAQERAPNRIRLRVRRVRARKILALVDGVPVRQLWVPEGQGVFVLTLPLVAERFTRDESVIELRFLGVVKPGTTAAPGPQIAAEVDWVHLVKDDQIVQRVTDLVADVRIDRTPRRSLTIYPPTRLSWVTVLPAHAEFRASVGAEATRGGPPRSVRARVIVETDEAAPVQTELIVVSGAAWQPLNLSLSALANKTVRITVAAEAIPRETPDESILAPDASAQREDIRLAIADAQIGRDPSLHAATLPASTALSRHALFVVVRGLREDRILPTPNVHLTTGTFARLLREGATFRAIAASTRPLGSVATMMTGLLPPVHAMQELTDTLDENAPTLASLLRDGGVATGLFTDDSWFIGSGLDRGFVLTRACQGDQAICRPDSALAAATEWLIAQRDRRAMAMVVTRATMFPLDPPRDILLQLDPTASDGPTIVEPSAMVHARGTLGALGPAGSRAQPTQREHAVLRYDAALAGLDRALGQAIDRLSDAHTLSQTTVIVAGDRGNTIAEPNVNPDFLGLQSVVTHTVVMMLAPGLTPGVRPTIVAARDAVPTVLERLGVQSPWTEPFAPLSLTSPALDSTHRLGVLSSLGPRLEPSLRFGEFLALQRGVNLLLIAPEQDPTGQSELTSLRPIASAYAERVLAQPRETEHYTCSTRAISELISQSIRHGTYPVR